MALVLAIRGVAAAGDGAATADIPSGLPPDLKSLVERTFSADPAARADAAHRLGEMREKAAPAVPWLIRLLGDEEEVPSGGFYYSVDVNASVALDTIGEAAVEPCLAALRHSSGKKRLSIIGVLGSSGSVRAAEALAGLLSDRQVDIRQRAADALCWCLNKRRGRAQPVQVIPALTHAMKDRDHTVRAAATKALGNFRDPQVIGALADMLEDVDEDVRENAIDSLGEVGNPSAVPILLRIVQNNRGRDELTRALAARALGKLGDPSVVGTLARLLQDCGEPEQLRFCAVEGLGFSHSPQAMEAILRVLKNAAETWEIRAAAIRAVVELERQQAAPLLMEYAIAPREVLGVRFAAAFGLVKVTGGAVSDTGVVALIGTYAEDAEGDRYDRLGALLDIAKNGQTWAVRAAARKALGTNKVFGINECWFFLSASIAYYTLALGFWSFRYRKPLRRCQFTLGSMFLLTALVALGLPLAIATWNAW
ncbi:MAG: HEAT repeat domain-containing protein [Planctomycetaceae bacterium]|nr:HEAT repeat domain-containing protein [Planctomycetaceae bacterium]